MSISALTRSHEINFWLFLNWNQHLWTYSFLWNQHLTVFEVKLTSLNLRVFVESTFDCFWSEIEIFERWREIKLLQFLKWNRYWLTRWCEINILLLLSEINLFELTHWRKINTLLFLMWNEHLWPDSLSWFYCFKQNQHHCAHQWVWKQHFTVY